jgi:ribonuclease BN (tRNA processing enzyme)
VSQVRIQFLGSGDAFSSGGRFQACLHLSGAAEPILLDCGATSLAALKQAHIDPASIGWVALSHLHGDHFAGIPWLILDGQFAGRTETLVVAGPAGTGERLDRAFEVLYPGSSTADRAFEVTTVELQEGTVCHLGPAAVTPFAARHGGGAPAYSLRVEYGGRVIAYSGDTEWTESLVEAARGADLFVCECNFFDQEVEGHLNYRTLVERHAELGCDRIVLTHMGSSMLAHLAEIEFETADDRAVITLAAAAGDAA